MPIELPAADEDLLAQCDFEAFRSSGKGGQHVNKTDSAVRLRHRPTGLTATSRESRSQWRNRAACLRKLREMAAALNRRDKPRIATRKPASARRRNRLAKAAHSRKKRRRSGREWMGGEE